MSYSTLIAIPTAGPMEYLKEFPNGFGSAYRVWDALAKKYTPGFQMLVDDMQPLWGLCKDSRLEPFEQLAMAWTFDRAICEHCHAYILADALQRFDEAHPVDKVANHLPDVAKAIRKHRAAHSDEETLGYGLIATSVADDVWDVQDRCPNSYHDNGDPDDCCPDCGNERDDRRTWRPFDWSKDKDKGLHFFLSEFIVSTPPTAEGGEG